MTRVAWQFHSVVLDDILLNDGVAVLTFELGLFKCFLVKVALRDETIVARNMGSHLSCAHSQVVSLVTLLGSIMGKKVTRVASIGTICIIVLGFEVAAA